MRHNSKALNFYRLEVHTYTSWSANTVYGAHTLHIGHYGQLYTDGDDMWLGSCGMWGKFKQCMTSKAPE